MSKNIEMEKRVMLSPEQYHALKVYALKHGEAKEMVLINHYFDTPTLSLRNNHLMLRIRNYDGNNYELTLKVKGKDGDLEINEPIDSNQVDDLIKDFHITHDEILSYINLYKDGNIVHIASLKTERIEIQFKKYLFVLDKNYYSDIVDYNLEIESNSIHNAKKYIKKYCDEFGMQYSKKYQSKSRRAINKALGI